MERKIATLELDYKNKDAKARLLENEMGRRVQELQAKIAELQDREVNLEKAKDRIDKEKQAREQELEAMTREINVFKNNIGILQARIVFIEAEKGEMDARTMAEKTRLAQQVHDLEEQRDAAIDKLMEMEAMHKKTEHLSQPDDLDTTRACMTCKEYILYKEDDYRYTKALHLFDAFHRAHMVSTVTASEIRSGYTSKTKEFLDKSASF
jgi:DNA repair exonuclease SbcCD ATPase subunit